jgi:hypothetical protein
MIWQSQRRKTITARNASTKANGANIERKEKLPNKN